MVHLVRRSTVSLNPGRVFKSLSVVFLATINSCFSSSCLKLSPFELLFRDFVSVDNTAEMSRAKLTFAAQNARINPFMTVIRKIDVNPFGRMVMVCEVFFYLLP